MDAAGATLAAALEIEPVVLPFGRHNITLGPDALNPLLERLWPTAEAVALTSSRCGGTGSVERRPVEVDRAAGGVRFDRFDEPGYGLVRRTHADSS